MLRPKETNLKKWRHIVTKNYLKDILDIASQVLPFLTITVTFVSLAYTYGHTLSALHVDHSCDLIRLSCTYLP